MSVRITGENTESSIKIKTGLKSVKKTELFVKISVGRNRVTIIANRMLVVKGARASISGNPLAKRIRAPTPMEAGLDVGNFGIIRFFSSFFVDQ